MRGGCEKWPGLSNQFSVSSIQLEDGLMDFGKAFERVYRAEDLSYQIKGIITADKQIYPLGTDTKVLSSVFELAIRPIVYQIAAQANLQVREARAQNYYPDFTLMRHENDPQKIAVDVKTTYRTTETERVKFTLGSYTSFIRPGKETKNIEFSYNDYTSHWIVGFIYKRKSVESIPAHVYTLDELDQIPMPFTNAQIFVAEKWKIAGDKAGSGNTTNIGSIMGTIEDFIEAKGLFASEEEFLDYWRNYERTANARTDRYSNLETYRAWRAKGQK
jgi:hypothetical protein